MRTKIADGIEPLHGVRVVCHHDPEEPGEQRLGAMYGLYEVEIDGRRVAVERVNCYRDGGTTVLYLDHPAHTLTFPHRIGSKDRTPRLGASRLSALNDGEAVR